MHRVKLLIVNFTLDEQHPLLGHQVELACRLSRCFPSTIVLSTGAPVPSKKLSFQALGIPESPSKISRVIRVGLVYIYTLIRFRPRNVFFHMNANYAAIYAPIARMFGINVLLWYTHRSVPVTLLFAKFFVNRLLTATQDSISTVSKKTIAMGHHVNVTKDAGFAVNFAELNFLVMSRVSQSKNLLLIIESFENILARFPAARLSLVGPVDDESYVKQLLDYIETHDIRGVSFLGPRSRSQIQEQTNVNTIGVHASQGSLDKFPLEMIAMGIPVLSSNPIMLRIFGSWRHPQFISIHDEFFALAQMDDDSLVNEIQRRKEIVKMEHSMDSWIEKFSTLLK